MEKIYKLLRNKDEDALIGLQLLFNNKDKDIIDFFKEHCEEEDSKYFEFPVGGYDIKKSFYVELVYGYVVFVGKDRLRLRKKSSRGFAKVVKIITKEQFINGMY